MTERMIMAKTDTTTLFERVLAYMGALGKGRVKAYQLQALRAETTGLTIFAGLCKNAGRMERRISVLFGSNMSKPQIIRGGRPD